MDRRRAQGTPADLLSEQALPRRFTPALPTHAEANLSNGARTGEGMVARSSTLPRVPERRPCRPRGQGERRERRQTCRRPCCTGTARA